MNEQRHNEKFSSVFFYLPSTTDRKEKINHHCDNVNINPIDRSLDYLSSFLPDKQLSFRPDLLNSSNKELRDPQAEILVPIFQADG